MRFQVDHLTRYEYSRAVYLEPHIIRLRPRSDCFQRLLRYQLQIEPRPVVVSELLDAEGNTVAQAWFSDTTDKLELKVSFEVETLRPNPFDYLAIGVEQVPILYPEGLQTLLAASLDSKPAPDSQVARFAESLAEGVNRQVLPFLSELSLQLNQQFDVPIREVGDPQPAERTLQERRGACRDLAVLFVECCRSLGIAARFVSGYQQGDREAERRYMHAWAEVFIPGGGWRGYDPTHGLAIADGYVAVAASARPTMAAPTSGSFRGTGVTSRMHTELSIHTTPQAGG